MSDPKTEAQQYFHIGCTDYNNGDYESALFAFNTARGLDSSIDVSRLRGSTLVCLKKPMEAFEDLLRAEENDPRDPLVQNELGRAFGMIRCFSEAIDHFKRSIELDDRQAETHFNLALAYVESGDTSNEIEKCLTTAITLNNEFPEAFGNLGIFCRNKGRYKEAIIWLKRAVELEPKNFHWLSLLCGVYVVLEMFQEIQQAMSQAFPELEAMLRYPPWGVCM
jgi:tetratricopeptide (TPR) repeat protein